MNKSILSIAALLGLATAGSALAQGLDFATLDTDGSGELSFTELQAALPQLTQDDFDMIDADASGAISEQEFGVLMVPPTGTPEPAPAQ